MNTQEILILAIEKKYGKKISSFREVTRFSNFLEKEYQIYISVSTLRRFFKTIPSSSSPSKTTLNALCTYIGYENCDKFLEASFSHESMVLQQNLYLIKQQLKITPELKEYIINELNNDLILVFVESLFQRALATNSISFQYEVLSLLPEIKKKRKVPYLKENLALLIWQTLTLQDNACFKNFIALHKSSNTFIDEVILSYIDYDLLNFEYGYVLKQIQSESLNKQTILFTKLMLGLKQFLNENRTVKINLNTSLSSLPPILKGRYLSYQLILNRVNKKELEFAWNKLIHIARSSKEQNLFFIEVIHTLLIIQRIDLVEQILDEFYDDLFDISDGFTYLNRSIYLLAQSFVFLYQGKTREASNSLALINSLVIMEREFHLWFKLFYYISKYHTSKDQNYFEKYASIAKKIGFAYFNFDFCLNYFNRKKES